MQRPRRNRLPRLALIALVIALGLGTRRFGQSLPGFVATYAGDTLWALVAFLGIGLLLPRVSTWRVAALAMSFSVMIEVSQLYHAPWIDSIRKTTLGALVLWAMASSGATWPVTPSGSGRD
jgi:glycopeptide antibiotics resistance protein